MKDIARVELGAKDYDFIGRVNGKPATLMGIFLQPGANALSVADEVNGTLTKLQKAWVEADVPQCGYCQSGMVMAATALLAAKPQPTDADIDAAMTNICRCGTYQQVREAIHAAAKA